MRGLRALGALVIACGCGDALDPLPDANAPAVYIGVLSDSLFLGKTGRVTAIATGDSSAVAWPAFAWSSSDTTVIVIDSAGMMLGVGIGRATIAAEFGGRRDAVTIRVVFQRADNGIAFANTSTGYGRNCAIAANARAYCRDSIPGDSVWRYTPVPGGDTIAFTAFATSIAHRCGLAASKALYCWGWNGNGALGIPYSGQLQYNTAPVRGAGEFDAVTAGSSASNNAHTCALNASDDVVYCVGHNNSSQLGRAASELAAQTIGPTVPALHARSVATGGRFTCAIDMNDAVYCWGSAALGVTGLGGSFGSSATQRRISIDASVVALSSGRSHACALSGAGQVYCWGDNSSGQLGIGTADNASHPIPVAIPLAVTFASIHAGDGYTCALGAEGYLHCWGNFPPASLSARLGDRRYSPTLITSAVRFRSISSDRAHVCGVTTDNRALCF